MYLQDLNVLKEVPGYKVLLKAVIKSQIQMLEYHQCQTVWIQIGPDVFDLGPNCLQRLTTDDKSRHKQGKSKVEQLSDQTGEESVILTANTSDGTLCHLGSLSGKDFLVGRDEIKSQFLSHCLKKQSYSSATDILENAPKRRRRDHRSGILTDSNIPLDEEDQPQQFSSLYSTENELENTTETWKPQNPVKPVRLVSHKKRFKVTPNNVERVSEPVGQVQKFIESVPVKTETEITDARGDHVTANSNQNFGDESSKTGSETDFYDSAKQTLVKVEVNDDDDDEDMQILAIEPGTNTEGFENSFSQDNAETLDSDSSFNQSFQQDNNFLNPNTSMGDLSYTQTAKAKSKSERMKEYRARKKAQLGDGWLLQERQRVRKYYKHRANLNRAEKQQRREKVRNQVWRCRQKQKQSFEVKANSSTLASCKYEQNLSSATSNTSVTRSKLIVKLPSTSRADGMKKT